MKTKSAHLVHTPPAARVFAGVARRDTTPPPGIYARMWGAAKHDVAEGAAPLLNRLRVVVYFEGCHWWLVHQCSSFYPYQARHWWTSHQWH